MRDPNLPSADEVRALVRQVVEAALDGGASSPAPVLPAPAPAASSPAPAASAPAPAASSPAPASPARAASPGATPGAPERVAIAIGADHGGSALKDRIGEVLAEAGFAIHDCGTHGSEPVDYPDVAHAVARLVADGTCRWGIILDGAGIGSCMVANKVPGVRAALCHDLSSARNSREHNHANVLTLGARFVGEGLAIEIVRAWLGTAWGPGRHAARVEKIMDVERRYTRSTGEGRAG
jgi:ribose 5-phosphate isomerase B